ncbi:TerD family protein [Gordonia sp. CPCC 205333]|uniref:TerD family protein n=1 Tax=Gordonia sp. CPCC 205333 TaxID=3140790 RepID=UPI003AF33269
MGIDYNKRPKATPNPPASAPPPPAPSYPQQQPGYPQPPAPGYPQQQQPVYPPQQPGYPQPPAPGYPPQQPPAYQPPQPQYPQQQQPPAYQPPGQQPPAYPQQPPAGGPPVSLSKVTLTKESPTVSLTKQGSVGGSMRVNLNWSAAPAQGGFFKRLAAPRVDLDLGCLYEFTDGSKGVVQALGNAFTNRRGPANVLQLDGDDRSGSISGGENLHIDLSRAHEIRRILVFAYIYEGAANWSSANGVVTLFPAAGPAIEVRLDNPRNGVRFCAIAMLDNVGGDMRVIREERYVEGDQSHLDAAYNWGLRWSAGRK